MSRRGKVNWYLPAYMERHDHYNGILHAVEILALRIYTMQRIRDLQGLS